MKTIQMTIDEPLLEEVDRVVQRKRTTRSAFVRHALEVALERERVAQLEDRHERGYAKHPPDENELESWTGEQHWGDE